MSPGVATAVSGLDADRCYRAVESRDERFDGWFITGVRTTGIYCRPSCPTPVRPKRANVEFFPTTAAAQRAGFRACKRCRPDATPGSPEWDLRADLVGRAMRLIADGVVDRDGVPGLASRLAVGARHLHRVLVDAVGAGPLALARANRAQAARVLIETTDLAFADVAFASGFSSIRQFNDTVRAVFAVTPTQLRRARRDDGELAAGGLTVRLSYRPPFDSRYLLGFLAARSVDGVEHTDATTHRRSLRLPNGTATIELEPADGYVRCRVRLDDMADLAAVVQRCRRLLDLDADPDAVAETIGSDAAMAPLVRRFPGLRAPGAVDATEIAVRAVVGQQVSVAAARTMLGRLVERVGAPATPFDTSVVRCFPTADELADADLDGLGFTTRRVGTLRALADAVASGRLALDVGADRAEVRAHLLTLPGVGPWTVDYVAMRALGDPDVVLASDLIVRRSATARGLPARPATLADRARRWSPWRSYATHLLWAAHTPERSRHQGELR